MPDNLLNMTLSQEDLFMLFQNSVEKQDEENKNLVELFHEQIGAELMALKLKLSQAQISTQLKKHVEQSIAGVVEKIKLSSNELFPSALELLGLEDAIKGRVRSYKQKNKVDIIVNKLFPEKITLSTRKAVTVFFIIDELIKNCLLHSECGFIKINLKSNSPFELEITDDGNGFEYQMRSLRPEHRGLSKVLCRTKALNAEINFDKLPLKGSKVTLKIND
jgi:signal transduction histidine kinase